MVINMQIMIALALGFWLGRRYEINRQQKCLKGHR